MDIDEAGPVLRVGSMVFTDIYNIKSGRYEQVRSLVLGRWRTAADPGQSPWLLAVELHGDVGVTYRAGEVVCRAPEMVSWPGPASSMPGGRRLTPAHLRPLPQVWLRRNRVVGVPA